MNKEVLVCSQLSNFKDDLVGFCADCRCCLFLRPYAQHVATRLCAGCFLVRAERMQPGKVRVGVLRASLQEVRDFLRRKK